MGEKGGEFLSLLSRHHFVHLHAHLLLPVHPPFLHVLSLMQVYESIQIAGVGAVCASIGLAGAAPQADRD